MNKAILVAAAALTLSLPAAALAAKPTPKPANPNQAALVAKNSAWACKSLRTQNAATFKATFGTNATKSNAYGKCVSAHAKANRPHKPLTVTFRNLAVASTGTITAIDANASCNTSATGCTLTSTGTLNGVVGGTYSSTWTILWTQATSNSAGGFCAPATGTTTLTIAGLGSLAKVEHGTVCEVGATGANVEHTLQNGTFTVDGTSTSTTGIFHGATGAGSVNFDQKPGTTTALGGAVTGTETFDTLTLTL